MKPVIFLESARSDLRESASQRIGRNPEGMQILEAQIRRWPVEGFPHGVLYRILADRVAVLAVFHPRRNPAVWKGRV